MKTKLKNLTLNLALVAFSTAIAFCGAEVVCRMTMHSNLTGAIFEYESTLGHHNRANVNTTQVFDGIRTAMRTNQSGFRMDREVGPRTDPDEIRVLFLGDSFVFGTGVNVEDGIVARLERETRAAFPGKNFLFINSGVGGYGTQNEIAFLEMWKERLQPDAVILILGPNDVDDNFPLVSYRRNEEGRLILNSGHAAPITATGAQRWAHRIPFYDELTQYSHAFGLIRGQVAQLLSPRMPAEAPQREVANLDETRLSVTKELFLLLKKNTDRDGLPLLVASVGQVPSYGTTLSFIKSESPWFVKNGFNYFDPTEEMAKITKGRLLFVHDGHYNAYGNEVLAKALGPKVKVFLSKVGGARPSR